MAQMHWSVSMLVCVCELRTPYSALGIQFMDFPFIGTFRASDTKRQCIQVQPATCASNFLSLIPLCFDYAFFESFQSLMQFMRYVKIEWNPGVIHPHFEGFESIIDAIWCNVDNTEKM